MSLELFPELLSLWQHYASTWMSILYFLPSPNLVFSQALSIIINGATIHLVAQAETLGIILDLPSPPTAKIHQLFLLVLPTKHTQNWTIFPSTPIQASIVPSLDNDTKL